MALMLWFFLLITSLYHILVTVFVYGLNWFQPESIVILRDGIRLIFCLALAAANRKQIFPYLKRTWKLRVVFLAICIVGIAVSINFNKTSSDIIIGMKYGLQFFVIFLMAIFVGQVIATRKEKKRNKLLRGIFTLLTTILACGLIWQIAKMIWPDIFYQIGYAPLGDWVYGQNPPLYYLTGPGGYPRLSGIFSGPNNYGYLLVGMFGFWRRYIQTHIKQKSAKILLWSLFIVSLLRTMSRGAVLGIFLQVIALSLVVFRTKRKYIRMLIVGSLVIVGALSVLKRGSTMAHVRAKFGSLGYVVSQPIGYGLGSSGPSIHTGHGTILPENFFLQILIDIGIPGFILWLLYRYFVMRDIRKIKKKKIDADNNKNYILLTCLSFGFLGLLFEGMFLHVFEDSMVNYRFFILWGMVYGYVLSDNKKNSV